MNEDIIDLFSSESATGEEIRYSVEQVATMTAVSVTLVRRLVALNVIEAEQDQLPAREITRLTQILRLRRDLSVNWIGARMVLDMSQEIARLKALLQAYSSHSIHNNFEK
jgi:MerR HTH family regulatory protein